MNPADNPNGDPHQVLARLSDALNALAGAGSGLELEDSLLAAARAVHRLLAARLTLLFSARDASRTSPELLCISEGALHAVILGRSGVRTAPQADAAMAVSVDPAELEWVVAQRKCAILPADEQLQSRLGVAALVVIPLAGISENYGLLASWTAQESLLAASWIPDLLLAVATQFAMMIEKERVQRGTHQVANLLESILESIPVALIATDVAERILEINRSASFLFGLGRIDALEEKQADVLPPEVAAVFSALAAETLRDGMARDGQVELAVADRTPIALAVTASPIQDRVGAKHGVLFVCRDVSLSRELQQRAPPEDGDRAHTRADLASPLAALVATLEQLAVGGPRAAQETGRMIGAALDGARRLQKLVRGSPSRPPG